MLPLNLTVYIELADAKLINTLKSAALPQDAVVEFSDSVGEGEFSHDRAHLVITDSRSRADELSGLDSRSVHIVMVGDHPLDDRLDDVWHADDSSIKQRFERLLGKLSLDYKAWFYENTLYTTIDTVPDMLWFKRLDGIHTMVNNAFTEVVHKTRDDIIGKDHFYIWDAPRPAEGNNFACAESEENAINSGKMYVCDEPVRTRDGMKQLTTYKTPVYDMFGNVFGTVGVAHDVTNFSNLGIELSILVENLPFPMIILTAGMKVVRMNEAFMDIAGIEPEDVESFDYRRWSRSYLVPAGEKRIDAKLHRTRQEHKLFRNNEERYYVVRTQEIRDFFDNISGHFVVMNDVTYQRTYEQSILKAANTDMLTGMYNRRYFYSYLGDNASKPMTLFYMDLDRFKYVNDNFGHAKGDEVLKRTSKVIKTIFPGAVSARLGGDEFALVLDGVLEQDKIDECSRNLENTIKRIFTADGLPVTMSIGVATYDGSDGNIDALMHRGDELMYEVKKQHHNEDNL